MGLEVVPTDDEVLGPRGGSASIDDAWWPMAVFDRHGHFREVNHPFAALLGRDVAHLVGSSVFDVLDRTAIAPELAVAERLVGGEAHLLRYERSFELPDGSTWQGTVLMSVVRDGSGEPDLFHLRLTEPGERRPPERIAWREGDFPLALDAMRVGVAIIGLDGTALQVNQALCEITGRSQEELGRIDMLSFTHPDDREADVRLGTQAWLGEIDSYSIEKRLVRPDDSIVWVQQELTFARDEQGELLHLIGQVIDINDRKAVEHELARSRQETLDLIRRLPIGLVTSDDRGRVITANPAAAAIVGVPVLQPGFDVTAVVHPDDLPELVAVGRAMARTGSDYHAEFRIRRADGETRWVRTDAHPDTDEAGIFTGLSGTWLDITDLKTAEQALHLKATHDLLTGLPNRLFLFEALAAVLERCGRSDGSLALLFVDLDGFKDVNDAQGHAVGDAVLAEVGDRLRSVVDDPSDLIARFGGDEFLVLCARPADPAADAQRLADRIIGAIAEPFAVEGVPLHIGASVGIAEWRPAMTADDLVGAADAAVYQAKRSGRGRWHQA